MESLLLSASGYDEQIEIVISDNASTDDTAAVVSEFVQRSAFIRYHRNDTNVGSEPNRYIVVGLATGKYIWIFSDDDKVTEQAVAIIMKRIESAYNLIVCNFSVWSRDFSVRKMRRWLPMRRDREFTDHNALMKCFGLHVGFTPSFIIKREDFLSVSPTEYAPFMQCGFPHVYSVYAAMSRNCR
ncbi:MAG: glycosyltransferase family 2 protein, partial [Dehalococcoidia bacterium]